MRISCSEKDTELSYLNLLVGLYIDVSNDICITGYKKNRSLKLIEKLMDILITYSA